jgi:hypothetical protein
MHGVYPGHGHNKGETLRVPGMRSSLSSAGLNAREIRRRASAGQMGTRLDSLLSSKKKEEKMAKGFMEDG